MAVVRDFDSYKKKRASAKGAQGKGTASSGGRLGDRRALFIRTGSVIIVVILLALISYISWRDKVFTQVRTVSEVNIVDAVEATCVNLDGDILQYSKDGMSLMKANGDVVWNRTYEIQVPMVEICGSIVAIGDYNGRTIYVADTTSSLGEITTALPIRSFHVASQGVVAVVLDDAEVTWINLYDTKGTELAAIRTTMGDSGYPLSVSISPSGRLVCVSFLTVDDAHLKTIIAFYNFGEVGKNRTDNFASSFIYEDIVIPRVRFMDDSHIYAIGTDRILFFEGEEIPVQTEMAMLGAEEIRSVYESPSHVGIVFSGGSDEGAFRLEVYDKAGAHCFTQYLDHEYEGLLFANNQVVLYDSDAWRVISMKGLNRYEGSFEFPVRAVIPTDVRSRFLLVASDRIRTVELR